MSRPIGPRELALRAQREATFTRNHSQIAKRKEKASTALAEVTERVSKPMATKGRKKALRSRAAKSTAKAVE